MSDGRPAYAEIDDLARELPPTERAAVVLRYGYDLAYADIATALGSSESAARQATSSGVRRLRRRGSPMTVSTELDRLPRPSRGAAGSWTSPTTSWTHR